MAIDLDRMGIGWRDAEMLGEHGGEHDMRHGGGIAAQEAVDIGALQPGIGQCQLGGAAHEVNGR
jgi:hypothetical protein